MKIKVSYESNHGKKHYLEFDSVADFIKKYEADPKLGVRFACGVEAQFMMGSMMTNGNTTEDSEDYIPIV